MMVKTIFSILFLSSFLFAQEMRVSFETGDDDINHHLSEVDAYAKAEYQFFKKDLSLKFEISTRDIDRFIYDEKVRPGDLYYACTMSIVTGKHIYDVISLYKEKKGWGAVAQEYGIKPGSKEFHRLKGKSISGIGKVKSKHLYNSKGNSKAKK
jgi:replicative superfamily II helicase